MLKVGFLGAGKMAQALAKGFVAAGLTKGENIAASCAPHDVDCIEAFERMGALVSTDNLVPVRNSGVVFLAVKPTVLPQVLREVRCAVQPQHLLLSVAMGTSIRSIEESLLPGCRVIRVMPNTPALVGCGASVFTRGTHALPEDAETTRKLLEAVGTCDEVPESLVDPVTALSGSGPAYVFMMIEALADGAVKMGLPRDLAYKLTAQTVLGAGKMVQETKLHPGLLKDNVTSPAGSTAEGLHFLEQSKVRAAFIGAIEAATQRCKAMGTSIEQKMPDDKCRVIKMQETKAEQYIPSPFW